MLFLTQKWALVRKLEEVHVVCPHPSSSRLVGVVADNRDSGTIHCYCFLTKRGNTVSLLQHVYMYVGVKHMYVCSVCTGIITFSWERTSVYLMWCTTDKGF